MINVGGRGVGVWEEERRGEEVVILFSPFPFPKQVTGEGFYLGVWVCSLPPLLSGGSCFFFFFKNFFFSFFHFFWERERSEFGEGRERGGNHPETELIGGILHIAMGSWPHSCDVVKLGTRFGRCFDSTTFGCINFQIITSLTRGSMVEREDAIHNLLWSQAEKDKRWPSVDAVNVRDASRSHDLHSTPSRMRKIAPWMTRKEAVSLLSLLPVGLCSFLNLPLWMTKAVS